MQALLKNYIPLFILALNIAIKLIFISSQDISHDEPFTIYHAQFDFLNIIHYLKNYNNPPLFELIMHFWIKYFGISPLSVRFLPMLFSSISVLFVYKIGFLIFDKKTAIVSSLLFTFSSFQIFYSHDCRVYSLFLLLTLISFYLYFLLVKKRKISSINMFFYILINSLLLYAHYFGFIVLFMQISFALFFYFYHK